MQNMVIIRNEKGLVLAMSKEKVYFLYQNGNMIDNGFNYDDISNKFNDLLLKK